MKSSIKFGLNNMKVALEVNVPILTYHSIDNSDSVISTNADVFARQMKLLRESGYEATTLETFVRLMSENKTLPPKTVVLTFDDGFQNFYSEAFPILDEFGFKATVFLVTDFCGKYNNWKENPSDFPKTKMLTWDEAKELSDCGIEFGAHTRTHPDLTRTSLAKLEDEIVESKAVIEDSLGREVTTFAYPFGKFNLPVKQVVENTFKAACSTNLGRVRTGSDYFALERIDTYYLKNLRIFDALSTNCFDGYLKIRQVMRTIKAKFSSN
jgi:peptidoglycan/xylan/chitin deacetylase (PgdA/CDA1 family)